MELVKVKSNSASGIPTININKTGVMRLSPTVKEGLKLKAGDKVGFYFEKDNPKNWSLKINDDDITLRNADKEEKAILSNSSAVANKILSSFDFVNKMTLRVALKPFQEDYFALLASSAKGE